MGCGRGDGDGITAKEQEQQEQQQEEEEEREEEGEREGKERETQLEEEEGLGEVRVRASGRMLPRGWRELRQSLLFLLIEAGLADCMRGAAWCSVRDGQWQEAGGERGRRTRALGLQGFWGRNYLGG